jgi:uncharacterized protein YcnI
MNKKNYTKSGKHPDDAISEVKEFINKLQKVQEQYYDELLVDLKINEDLETWLFDYIYNEKENFGLTFTEYLETHGKSYE